MADSIPMDDDSLRLIQEALNSVIIGSDEEGNPVRSGEFSLSRLLEFWSGYDPDKLQEVSEGVFTYSGTMFSQYDLMRALVGELLVLRSGIYLAVASVLEEELGGDLRLDLNDSAENRRFWRLVERIEAEILDTDPDPHPHG